MRRGVSKMMTLEGRHPGICRKVHAMFDEDWPAAAIKRIIETHYGERISGSTLQRYKREHWRRLREQVQQANAALLGSASAAVMPEGFRPKVESLLPAAKHRCHRPGESSRRLLLGTYGPAFIWRFGPVVKSTLRILESE